MRHTTWTKSSSLKCAACVGVGGCQCVRHVGVCMLSYYPHCLLAIIYANVCVINVPPLHFRACRARWELPAGRDDEENQLREREREGRRKGEFACVSEKECKDVATDRSSREKLI